MVNVVRENGLAQRLKLVVVVENALVGLDESQVVVHGFVLGRSDSPPQSPKGHLNV